MKKNWYTHPTKLTLLIFGIIWLKGNLLLLAGVTDLFTDFNAITVPIWGLIGTSSLAFFQLLLNFLRSRQQTK